MTDPQDIKAVAAAFHTVLKQKGFDNFVSEAEVQSIAKFVVETLDYDRGHRDKPVAPQPIKLSRAGLQNPPKDVA